MLISVNQFEDKLTNKAEHPRLSISRLIFSEDNEKTEFMWCKNNPETNTYGLNIAKMAGIYALHRFFYTAYSDFSIISLI